MIQNKNRQKQQTELRLRDNQPRGSGADNHDWITKAVSSNPEKSTLSDFFLPASHHPNLIKGSSRYVGKLPKGWDDISAGGILLKHLSSFIAGPIISYLWDPLPADTILSLAVTQDISLHEQLYHGVRFMDVRLRTYKGDLYTAHGQTPYLTCIGSTFTSFLGDVKKFLESNEGEFLVLSLRWEYGSKDWSSVESSLSSFLPKNKYFYTKEESDPEKIAYNEIKGRIIMCEDDNLSNYRSKLKCHGTWKENDNQKETDELISKLENNVITRGSGELNFLEAVLTPVTELKDIIPVLKAMTRYETLVDIGHRVNRELMKKFLPEQNGIEKFKNFKAIMIDSVSEDILDRIVRYNNRAGHTDFDMGGGPVQLIDADTDDGGDLRGGPALMGGATP